jgi:hypothetical protein
MAHSTLNKLRAIDARGPALRPGSVVMFGWAPLKLFDEDGDWVLHEPDFRQPQLTWVRGIGTTLRVLNWQAAVIHALGVTPRQTLYDDFVLVEPGAESAPHVFLDRVEPRLDHESGWYAGVDREGCDRAEIEPMFIPAARLLDSCPHWVPYLALPPGFHLVFQDHRLVQVFDPDGHNCLASLNPTKN